MRFADGCGVGRSLGGKVRALADNASGRYVDPTGEFIPDQRYIATRITGDGRDGYPVEPGRYRLVVS